MIVILGGVSVCTKGEATVTTNRLPASVTQSQGPELYTH